MGRRVRHGATTHFSMVLGREDVSDEEDRILTKVFIAALN